MNSNNRISALIPGQLPFFVRNDHPNFVAFLEAYYRYLEQDEKVINRIKNIQTYQNIDLTPDEYANLLYNTFMKYIPENIRADKRLLLKHIKDFYRAKGTEKSVRFLMNILYEAKAGDAEVNFYYPKEDILRVSDGKWYIQRSLRIQNTTIDDVADTSLDALQRYFNSTITGETSHATAVIESVNRFYERGLQIDELLLSNINGSFENGETIGTTFVDEFNVTRSVDSVVYGGIIDTVTLTVPGTGYIIGDPVIIHSNTGNKACVIVSAVSPGNLAAVSVVTGGAGYQNGNPILFSGGGGAGANATVFIVYDNATYHPNSYNIVGSTIQQEANTPIGNVGPWQTFAYQNLTVQWTNTSNLTVNTGAGATVQTINLSAWKQNSNVFFETYDSLNVKGTIVIITASNIKSNVITVSPGLSGNLLQNSFTVIKKPNVSTIVGNSIAYWSFANTGPVQNVRFSTSGSNYISKPEISAISNTTIVQLGILGRMEIISGGNGYVIGDIIEFINKPGTYGFGAIANVTNVDGSGAITEVKFQQMSGHIVGGSGFSALSLPTTNVRTSTGTSANIAVVALLGTGATFAVENTTLGAIEKITIISGGQGFTEPPVLDFTQSGDRTARANCTVVSGVYSYPGRYLNDDGHLSSFNFLEDRDYYQNFSYVIRSCRGIEDYRNVIENLTHPAGTKLFGQFEHINNVPISPNSSVICAGNNIELSKTYVKMANTINVAYDSHGKEVGNTITLEFTSGGRPNVTNGLYAINAASTNWFTVHHPYNYANTGDTTITGNVTVGLHFA